MHDTVMHDTVIFLGPSLCRESARSVLDATYLPPVKRDDLARLGPNIRNIGIVDGEFFQSLSVSPREILPFLDRGVRVFGSSSMGALRAAETHMYGMVGVGAIFEMFRDGLLDADDEVAVTYEPDSYRTTSEALVNIRFALSAAARANVVTHAKAEELVGIIKQHYFPERTYQLVSQLCPDLKDFLAEQRLNQKRDDALLLLQTMASLS